MHTFPYCGAIWKLKCSHLLNTIVPWNWMLILTATVCDWGHNIRHEDSSISYWHKGVAQPSNPFPPDLPWCLQDALAMRGPCLACLAGLEGRYTTKYIIPYFLDQTPPSNRCCSWIVAASYTYLNFTIATLELLPHSLIRPQLPRSWTVSACLWASVTVCKKAIKSLVKLLTKADGDKQLHIELRTNLFINPRRMRKGYCSWFVYLSVCYHTSCYIPRLRVQFAMSQGSLWRSQIMICVYFSENTLFASFGAICRF